MEILGLNIDKTVLQRIQKRVMIVGRFNRSRVEDDGKDPERYLFTNDRSDANRKYRDEFTGVGYLKYEDFVSLLRPKIAETVRLESVGGSRNSPPFSSVTLEIPANGEDEGTIVIEIYDYFFTRAVSKTDQAVFGDAAPPSTGGGLLENSDFDRGKEILKQIRQNLTTFCEFQPRHQQLLVVAAYAFEKCKGDGLPGGFNAGNALPKEFAPAFIDFVYDEDTTKSFGDDENGYIKRLDFDLPKWDELLGDAGEPGKKAFVQVVDAVRDHLLEGDAIQYSTNIMNKDSVRNHVAKSVREAQEGTDSDLVKAFGKSRTSFNSLQQIVKSKVLLSMILEWLMQGFYDLPTVRPLKLGSEKEEAIESAIANGLGVAPAVSRPNKEERKKFSKALTDNFATVLTAVVGRGRDEQTRLETKKAARDALQKRPELLALVEEMANNGNTLAALQFVAGSTNETKDTDRFDGFVDACKTLLLDVLMPVLYRKPIVTSKELEDAFRKESLAVYLTAIFLSGQNQNEFVRIAEDNLDYFETKINNGKISDIEEIQKTLLSKVYTLLADPRVGKEIEQGTTVIREIQALQVMAGNSASTSMGEVIVAGWTDGKEGKVLEKTESTALVDSALRERVNIKVNALENKVNAAAVAKSENSETEGTTTAERNTEGTAQDDHSAVKEGDGVVDEILSKLTVELDNGIDRIMQELAQSKGVSVEQFKPEDIEEIKGAVAQDDKIQKITIGLTNKVKSYEKTMDLIYRRYNENEDKEVFRNKVERMTLINLMLLWRKELGFKKVQSNLYRLLLDLILETNPDNPDRADFLRAKSLTEYFDNEDLANGGFGKLENVLGRQAHKSLENVVDFVSELRGVKYLMDLAGGDAEVIVINADADEFKEWFAKDNIDSAKGRGRFRTSGVSGNTKYVTYPALIYFTGIAFKNRVHKTSWLKGLANWELRRSKDSALSAIIPPICVSTGAQNDLGGTRGGQPEEPSWETEGKEYKAAAQQSLAPVVIVGPSPRLNPENDGFPTILPAGYLLAASVIGSRVDGLTIVPAVGLKGDGRFCSLCPGAEKISDSLANVVSGSSFNRYSLAVDLYLYIVMLVILRVTEDSRANIDNVKLWRSFYFRTGSSDARHNIFGEVNAALGKLVFGCDMSRYALADFIPNGEELRTILKGLNEKSITSDVDNQVQHIKEDYGWFNRALAALKISTTDVKKQTKTLEEVQ